MSVTRIVMGDGDDLERRSTEAARARSEAREDAPIIVPFTYQGHNFQYRSEDNTIRRVDMTVDARGEIEPDDIEAQVFKVDQLRNNVHGHSVFQVRLGRDVHFQVTIDTQNGGVQEIKSMTNILAEASRANRTTNTPETVQGWFDRATAWLKRL